MDRLSVLPEDVICHILSLLPIKSSVRTSTLARGWRYFWAHVPFLGLWLNFNGYCREITEEANNTIIDCPNIVSSFHIGFCCCNDNEFRLWISFMFACNVRTLVISLNDQLMLPRFLFNCKTLVDLSLIDCAFIRKDGTVYLPALKKLHLVNVVFDSCLSLCHFLCGCPVLEELIIERIALPHSVFRVYSASIIRLVCDIEVDTLRINLPPLRYLRLHPLKALIISRKYDSLIEADIDMTDGDYHNIYNYSAQVHCFVRQMYNVKRLTLSSRLIKPVIPFPQVEYPNLTELNLCAAWCFITIFLEEANNLRVLTISRMADHNDQDWKEPKKEPACLVSHLETLNLVDFDWSAEHEFDMVKYILRKAKVLKMVEIMYTPHIQLDSNQKLKALKRLALFERGSKTCQLAFDN